MEDTKVIDAHIFQTSVGTGICVLTGAYRLYVTNSIKDVKVRKLAEIPGENLYIMRQIMHAESSLLILFLSFLGPMDLPSSWAVLCEDRQTFVLLSKGMELFYISEAQVIQKVISNVFVNSNVMILF